MQVQPAGTLAQYLFPTRTTFRDVGLITAGAAVTALAAQATIPWQPVPFTLQTMAVMACGLALGMKRGIAAQGFYLLAGIRLPVFAGGAFGGAHLIGPTGGYLFSFVVIAGLLGYAADQGWDRSFLKMLGVIGASITLNLGLGWLWLAAHIGASAAYKAGVAPFLLIECLKAIIVVPVMPLVWKGLRRK